MSSGCSATRSATTWTPTDIFNSDRGCLDHCALPLRVSRFRRNRNKPPRLLFEPHDSGRWRPGHGRHFAGRRCPRVRSESTGSAWNGARPPLGAQRPRSERAGPSLSGSCHTVTTPALKWCFRRLAACATRKSLEACLPRRCCSCRLCQLIPVNRLVNACAWFPSLTDRISFALREYRARHRAKTGVIIRDRERLASILGSAAVFRLDPMSVIASTSPGEGMEPQRPLPASLALMPIVGVVDGGLTAASYQPAEAWRAQSLVPTGFADAGHGNKVTSLIVQGRRLEQSPLQLPALYCRVGIVQAVPRDGLRGTSSIRIRLRLSFDVVMATSIRKREVWNLSLNQRMDCDLSQVSALAHDLAVLRAASMASLLVIAIGNQPSGRMQPPADCEVL